ncbi:hypothetical protein Dsin_027840 [Dipteronia sinensis]|uniref:RNase H type-1 domain-containing protein n=1 Tax=Dipteronia sinensis TaxID=43782 RepID=A0AAD9ZPX7_9ROSI|nr:hypothetical protein Dsin_027840 [Dipteronia sinensis]
MRADITNNRSQLWRSLYWGSGLLDLGTRWRIWTRSSVRIFEDKWLPRPVTFKVITPKVENGIWLVRHLRTTSGAWTVSLIKNMFVEVDANAILSIPYSLNRWDDFLCWHYTPDGNYSVKSGYKVGMSLTIKESTSEAQRTGFGWKVLCVSKISFLHVLKFWEKKELELLCVVLWRVWFLRNQLVQGVGWHGLETVVPWSEDFLADFMVVNGVFGIQREHVRQNEIKWHHPEVGFFNLNIDAAIDVQKWCVRLGMVVRDHFGADKACSTQRIEVRYFASVAEALAILRGISFAIYCGYDHLVIESDALGVVNMINPCSKVFANIGVIIEDIRCLL